MRQLGLIKSSFVIAALTAGAFTANAEPVQRDEQGFEKNPVCSYTLPKTLAVSLRKQTPTGETASTKSWDLAVYANQENKSWTLVGKNKAPNADPDELCKLAHGIGNYKEQKWHLAYFTAPDASKPKIAAIPQDPKPAMN